MTKGSRRVSPAHRRRARGRELWCAERDGNRPGRDGARLWSSPRDWVRRKTTGEGRRRTGADERSRWRSVHAERGGDGDSERLETAGWLRYARATTLRGVDRAGEATTAPNLSGGSDLTIRRRWQNRMRRRALGLGQERGREKGRSGGLGELFIGAEAARSSGIECDSCGRGRRRGLGVRLAPDSSPRLGTCCRG